MYLETKKNNNNVPLFANFNYINGTMVLLWMLYHASKNTRALLSGACC